MIEKDDARLSVCEKLVMFLLFIAIIESTVISGKVHSDTKEQRYKSTLLQIV